MIRIILGALVAPALALAVHAAITRVTLGRLGDPAVYFIVGLFSYVFAAILGAPLFFLFVRCRWLAWWQVSAIATIPPALQALEWLTGPPCCESTKERMLQALGVTLMGAAVGLAFWLIAVWRNPKFDLQRQADGSGRDTLSARRVAVGILAGGLLLFSYLLSQAIHGGARLTAKVVEMGSNKPLEGAVVVVLWQIERGRFHGHDRYILHRAEGVTDQDGRFQTDAWGPKYGGISWRMARDSPNAYFFKSGHRYEIVSNYRGAPVQLTLPIENPNDYAGRLSSIESELCDRHRSGPCSASLKQFFADERKRLIPPGARR